MSPGSGRWLGLLSCVLLLLTAILVGSADCHTMTAATGQGPLTVALTSRVKVQPGTTLTLHCGDRMTWSPAVPEPLHTGAVQFWHTPFGTLRDPGVHYSDLEPVSVQYDGSLVISNASSHHSGLYYCLLQDTVGVTIHPYQIHTDDEKLHQESKDMNQDDHNNSDLFEMSAGNNVQHTPVSLGDPSMGDPTKQAARQERSGAFRVGRDVVGVGSNEEEKAAISVSHLAGAVAASVVVTFLVGFSAGALSRVYVLRCVNTVTERVRRRRPTDATDQGCDVTMTTLAGMSENETFQGEEERGWGGDDSAWETTLETTTSSPSPPTKPQRSFRQKREDAPETTAYLERCDRTAQEKEQEEEMGMKGQKGEVAGAGGEAKTQGEGESETRGGGVSGDNGSSVSERPVSETDEERGSEVREEEEEERGDGTEEEEGQRAGEEKVASGVGEGPGRNEGEEEELRGSLTDGPSDDNSESGRSSSDSHEGRNMEEEKQAERTTNSNEGVEQSETTPRPPRPARRSRVIRLYQYDEEGQRYGHLPDPVSDELGPAPKPKQRSLSLTRLNAIMAAASAGPLDTPTREEREGGRSPSPPTEPLKSPVFHMDI